MRKKIILVFILSFFGFFANINAETFQCEYKFGNDDKEIYIFEYDITNDDVNIVNKKETVKIENITYSANYETKFYEEEINNYIKNECPILYMAKKTRSIAIPSPGGANGVGSSYMTYFLDYEINSDSFVAKNGGNDCINNRNSICLKNFFATYEYYYTGVLTDSDINKDNVLVSKCPTFIRIENKIKSYYNSYKNCSGKGCTKYLSDAKNEIDKLKTACGNILNYRDVHVENAEDENGKPIEDPCIDICLNINERLSEMKEDAGLLGPENGECGFSTRLASWGLNIMKWIKYIVPVFVIIFGIFDFIKAIGADKEDEMKKSQKKFITRLIAAALIFIIPFILEFVLDKFGFTEYIDGCDVITEID